MPEPAWSPRPIPTVLHVPYTYFPDPSGGTEVFVRMLAQRLAARGYPSAIAAPALRAAEYEDAGLRVHRFAIDPAPVLAHAYGAPDEVAAAGFASIVARLRPRIVHLHARTVGRIRAAHRHRPRGRGDSRLHLPHADRRAARAGR